MDPPPPAQAHTSSPASAQAQLPAAAKMPPPPSLPAPPSPLPSPSPSPSRRPAQSSPPTRIAPWLLPYTAWCMVVFTVLALTTLLVNLFQPDLRGRRRLAGRLSRGFLRCIGVPFTVRGRELLPPGPCVVVANHASYIDGIVAIAALPPDFAFVIKKEMVTVPLAGLLLRRLGSEFVERFDRHKGATDARRVLRTAAAGQSLVFFPEGTFDEHPRIGKFRPGAFATAARSNLPVVPMAIHGTRAALPPGGLLFHRRPIRVEILAVLPAQGSREASRQLISAAVGEPLEL